MKRFSYRTIILAGLALIAGIFLLWRHKTEPAGSVHPWSLQAIRDFGGKIAYYNPAAAKMVEQAKPALIQAAGPQAARFPDAPINTPVFRQLDRKLRFDSLLLAGDPALYFPLLQHLIETGDWTLVYVDEALMIFQRLPDRAWTVAHLGDLEKNLSALPKVEQEDAWLRLANQMQALRKMDRAKEYIDDAVRVNGGSAPAENQRARFLAQEKDYKGTLAATDRALKKDGDYVPALFLKVQTMLTLGKFTEAWPFSKELIDKCPDDPQVLYLHAKIAHGVRALTEEEETLTRLVKMAEAAGQPTATYRIYLGQAQSSIGKSEEALKTFETALKTDELPPDQREFGEQAANRLRDVLHPAATPAS